MKTAIIGIGLPGVGKTTALKNLAVKENAIYICPDDIRQEITGDASDQSRNREVWEEAYRRIHAELDAGHSVVVDATNARKSDRLRLVAHCRRKADNVYGMWFVAPLQVILKRNSGRPRVVPESVIGSMASWLEADPPAESDGFDRLTVVETQH